MNENDTFVAAQNMTAPGLRQGLTDLSDMPYRRRRPARLWTRVFELFVRAGLGVWQLGLAGRDAVLDARENWRGAERRLVRRFDGRGAGQGRSVAIYAHFAPYSGVSAMVARQLRDYARLGFRIVFVSAAPHFTEEDFASIRDSVEVVLHRRNFGLDFGSWVDAITLLPDLVEDIDELLLVNDSVLGPIHPLDGPLAEMRRGGEGLFGMTDSVQYAPHLQSYFLLARGGDAIADLADFLQAGRLSVSKRRVVKRFEVALSGHMRDLGHRVAALWNYETLEAELLRSDTDVAALFSGLSRYRLRAGGPGLSNLRRQLLDLPLNPAHHFAGLLVRRCGYPFLKTELVQRNPARILDALQWRDLIPRDAPVSLALLEDHLASLERPMSRRRRRARLPQPSLNHDSAPENAVAPPEPKAAPAAEKPWQLPLRSAWERSRPAVAAPPAPTLSAESLARAVSRTPLVLSVSHDDYAIHTGGVQNVICEEQQGFAGEGVSYLHLSPTKPTSGLVPAQSTVLSVRLDGVLLGTASLEDLMAVLSGLDQENAVLATIIHHFSGHAPEQILALHQAVGSPQAIVWLHDFGTLCANPFLLRNDIAFCGAPPAQSAACGICAYGAGREAHMQRLRAFFEASAPTFLAPSRTALSFWQERIGLADEVSSGEVVPPLRLVPLPVPARQRAQDQRLRIAHVGMRHTHKGWATFAALAEALADDDRYAFLQLGLDLGHPLPPHIRCVNVDVAATKRTAMADVIAAEQVDVVINWSECFETFSFTAHEALAAGALLITHPKAGHIPAAIAEYAPGRGLILENAEALQAVFISGAIQELCARSPATRHMMVFGGASAEWLLARRADARKRILARHA
jgi:hypothetical protein